MNNTKYHNKDQYQTQDTNQLKEILKEELKKTHYRVREKYEKHFNIDAIDLPGSEGTKFFVYIDEPDENMEYIEYTNIISVRTDIHKSTIYYLDYCTFLLEVPLFRLQKQLNQLPLMRNLIDILVMNARNIEYLTKHHMYGKLANEFLIENNMNMDISRKEIFTDPMHTSGHMDLRKLYDRPPRRQID